MIGIFDSGVGGLTIVKQIFRYLPKYQIIYFGDTAHLPYGTKGEEVVCKYSEKITEWLLKKGSKIIIVACHTSSALAAGSLKEKFSDIPVFEMITPVVKGVSKDKSIKKIGIIGTPATIKSKTYQRKILRERPDLEIISKACPLLVPLVEEGWIKREETKKITETYLQPLKEAEIDTLVLACTHYPLLKKVIKEIMGKKVKIINPAESLAEELKKFLKQESEISSKLKIGDNHKFFFSDKPYHLKKLSQLALGKEIKGKIINPL